MSERELPERVIRTSFWLAAWFVLVFGLRGQADVAVGLAIGSAMSIFSLWTIARAVPRVTGAGSRRGPWLLAFLFVVKLPLYGLILNYALMSKDVNAGAVFAGVGVVPAVIVLKTLGRMMIRNPAP
jgi:hypothetical protein